MIASRIGQQLGHYRLTRLLGRGGFAEVYLGKHIFLETQAAIKVLYTQLAWNDIKQFIHEAQRMAHLEHPNIVRVLDFGAGGTIPFLAMAYAPGGTIRQRYPKGTRLPLPLIVEYVKQVAAALQYAHEQKFIHRDIKPENMLLGSHNEVLLSDFGIATVAHSTCSQSAQMAVGTLAYIAPEQIQEFPRPASDQYSLAVVVYQWLCGDVPFDGTITEVIAKHLTVPPPRLRERMPVISSDLEEVVMIALSKDYRQRFGSVQAFARALEQASQTTPVARSMQIAMPTPTPANLPVSSPPSEESDTSPQTASTISRRKVTLGLAGLFAASTGIAWLAFPPTPHHANKTVPAKPMSSLRPSHITYRGHSDAVYTADWSPDSKRIASGGQDKTVQLWNAATGATILTYRSHLDAVEDVAWSPDGKHIASCSDDKTVQVWDASTGAVILIYRGHANAVNAVSWSPDGRYLASGSQDKTVQVWEAFTGATFLSYSGHSSSLWSVDWSPDGRRIASSSEDRTVQVWDAFAGATLLTYTGMTSIVYASAWSPDGRRIASGSMDKTGSVWDTSTGATLLTYRGHSEAVEDVTWSPDGRHIASGSDDRTVRVWNASTGATILNYQNHSSTVEVVAWSPNGRYLASGSDDKTVQVWQASE